MNRIKWLFTGCWIFIIFACNPISTSPEESQTSNNNSEEKPTFKVDFVADKPGLDEATFAGGCFWCVEAVFERIAGVEEVISGYSGGDEENPTYKQVSYGATNHAEAVRIYYDPNIVDFPNLLEVFFATHDPTQLNRQGPDVGKQYRSAVFFHNDSQKASVQAYITKLEEKAVFNKPIVTQVEMLKNFYPAEEYHQDFYEKHPNHPYILAHLLPKLKKEDKLFEDLLKPEEVKSH